MSANPRISRPLWYLTTAAVALIVAGCASTPQNASSQATSPAAESPASPSKVVDTADFTKRAQDDGWRPSVRRGQVVYCKNEAPIDSRLPEMTCLNKTGVVQMMLAEEQQREQLQRSTQAPGLPQ
jgi:PBP1b-binding outer membrane lipoprotein LpoB